MKRTYLMGLVGMLLLAVVLPAQAVSLRYAFKKGTQFTYKIQNAGLSKTSGLGEDKGPSYAVRLDQTFRLKVVEVAANGDMELEEEVIGGQLKISAGDAGKQKALPKGTRRFRLTPLGEITALSADDPKSDSDAGNSGAPFDDKPFGFDADTTQLDFLAAGLFVPLPEKELKVGDSWESDFEVKASAFALEGVVDAAQGKAASELLEIVNLNGHQCAKIKTRYEAPFQGEATPKGAPFTIGIAGRVAGETIWYFDNAKSADRYSQGTMNLAVKMTAILPGGGKEVSTTIVNNMKTNLLDK